jgi:ribose 1,5-bisphosphokinase PhnN|nr:MAG TPA: tRNA threonylcarbamoyladenosine biosynthesis protein TsaB transfer complex, t6A biosynthesis [Caudoviricetes sp.]
MNKNVLYLVGASGSGKSSLARSLEKCGFNWIRGAVTRPTCLDPFKRHVIIGEPQFARDALGEGLLVVVLWAHPLNVRERLAKRGYDTDRIDQLLTKEVAELNGFAEYAREDALLSEWLEDGPTARARLRYRFAVCRNDTYWDRSQIIDFIEQEVVFD